MQISENSKQRDKEETEYSGRKWSFQLLLRHLFLLWTRQEEYAMEGRKRFCQNFKCNFHTPCIFQENKINLQVTDYFYLSHCACHLNKHNIFTTVKQSWNARKIEMFLFLSLLCFCVFSFSRLDLDFGSEGHLVAVREWREGIRLGVWNGSVNKRLEELEYNKVSEV